MSKNSTHESGFEDILDDAQLGNQPSAHYLERVDVLDNVVRDCMFVSRGYGGIAAPTARHFYASVLFTALITRGVSLAQLVPFSPWAEKQIEHWDYASATGIVRSMLELRIAFYYLCVEVCSQDEWDCRWNVFNLHDCTSRIRLFEARGEENEVQAFCVQADDLRERLRANPHFQSLPQGQQKKLSHGQSAYMYPLEDISEKSGLERSEFRWLYVLFSSHVHGLPMSFYRIGERGRGLPSPEEETYTSLCLSLASTFLVKTRDEVHGLFAEFKQISEKIIEHESAQLLSSEQTIETGGMAVGETMILVEMKDLEIEVTKVRENVAESVYRYKPTGEAVLRRTDSDQGTSLDQFDPLYWTVFLNNNPTTTAQLANLADQPLAFKADHNTRMLYLKDSKQR